MRSMWIISPIIAIGLVTSASAQGVDQNTKQQIEQIIAAYHDAWNNHSGAGLLLFTRKTLFWLRRLHRSSSTDNKKLSRTLRRRLPLSLIMIRQLPTKLYHLEPVNSCRLVNTT
jgi:hypothetical protein